MTTRYGYFLSSEEHDPRDLGPDPQAHIRAIRAYTDAGFDEVYVNQIGQEQEGFFEFYAEQVLPRLRSA